MPSIQDAFLTGIKKLKDSNIQSYQIDAKILLKYILDLDSENFELKKNCEISNLNLNSYFKLIKRRSEDEPVAYIVEKQSFWVVLLNEKTCQYQFLYYMKIVYDYRSLRLLSMFCFETL